VRPGASTRAREEPGNQGKGVKMRKQILSAFAVAAAVAAFAPTAQAAPCLGLACPSASSLLPAVPSAQDLTNVQASGYYSYGVGAQRAVAYVVARGQWASAPADIKALPLAAHLLPAETTSKWLVILGPDAMESGPWAPEPAAVTARASVKAHAAAASDCVSPWFCVFTNGSFGGTKCQWQSTGVWQVMPSDCTLQASSMVNRRSAWSLLKRNTDNRNYCAVPNSQDSSLSNNGFNDNTYETYNSTSGTKLSGWDCAN
jgi:hypothetical protein